MKIVQHKTMLYNRRLRRLEEESIGNNALLFFLNKNKIGKVFLELFFKRRFFTKLSGVYYRSRLSRPKINQFINKYNIRLDELKEPVESFKSFNAFFSRKLKEDARPIHHNPNVLIAPADSKMIYYKLRKGSVIFAKGVEYTLNELLQNEELARAYEEGICLVFRLAPTDYHRFCMIDDCKQGPIVDLPGYYNTVRTNIASPKAQITNHRQYCTLKTQNFDEVIQIEIGAMQIGRIKQNALQGGCFHRGDEKGYFEYGGSTIIQIFKQHTIELEQDIIKQSHRGIETIVKQGEKIGRKKQSSVLEKLA